MYHVKIEMYGKITARNELKMLSVKWKNRTAN